MAGRRPAGRGGGEAASPPPPLPCSPPPAWEPQGHITLARTCGDARHIMLPKLRREYCEYIPRFLIVNTRKRHEI